MAQGPKSSVEMCAEIESRTGIKRSDVEADLAEQFSFLRWVGDTEARGILWQALVDAEFGLRALKTTAKL